MTFEKTIGEFAGDGLHEISRGGATRRRLALDGGENDGQRHGPLRIRGLTSMPMARRNATLEMIDVRVKTSCASNRCCVLTASCEGDGDQRRFVATVRSLAASPGQGQVDAHDSRLVGQSGEFRDHDRTIPANGAAVSERALHAGRAAVPGSGIRARCGGSTGPGRTGVLRIPARVRPDQRAEPAVALWHGPVPVSVRFRSRVPGHHGSCGSAGCRRRREVES